jgi:hypothetical protein
VTLHAARGRNRPFWRGWCLEIVTRQAGDSRHAAIVHCDLRVALLAGAVDKLHRMRLELVALIAGELRLIDDVAHVPALDANILRVLRINVTRPAIFQIGLCVRCGLRTKPTADFDAKPLAETRTVAVLALLASVGMQLARLIRVAVTGKAIVRFPGNVVMRSITAEQRR